MSKTIIDNHFKNYYNYYRRVCFSLTSDTELRDELLHETYLGLLKVKESVITQFNSDDKLHFLGIKVLRSLWQKRKQVKNHDDGRTSPVFKTNNSFDISELNIKVLKDKEFTENDYRTLESAISNLLSNRITSTPVMIFLQVNETSISELHRNSGISRPYLTKQYNKGKQYLKQYIENAS